MEAILLAKNEGGEPYTVKIRFDGPRLLVTCSCPVSETHEPNSPCLHIRGVFAGEIETLIDGADPDGFKAVREWLATAGRLNH
jgi:hypothetical protein